MGVFLGQSLIKVEPNKMGGEYCLKMELNLSPLPLKLEVGAGGNIIWSTYKKTLQLWLTWREM